MFSVVDAFKLKTVSTQMHVTVFLNDPWNLLRISQSKQNSPCKFWQLPGILDGEVGLLAEHMPHVACSLCPKFGWVSHKVFFSVETLTL